MNPKHKKIELKVKLCMSGKQVRKIIKPMHMTRIFSSSLNTFKRGALSMLADSNWNRFKRTHDSFEV